MSSAKMAAILPRGDELINIDTPKKHGTTDAKQNQD